MAQFQQVNLLADGIIPKKELLHEHQVLIGWSGFVLVLIALSIMDGWQAGTAEDLLTQEQHKLEQMSQAVEQMEVTLAGGKASLQREIAELEERRRAQSALALALAAEQRQQGLSRALMGLADSALEGLWLLEIHVMPHGLHLKGNATDAVLLPRYIQALSDQDRFAGHSFNTVTMLLDDNEQTLAFELRAPENSGVGM